MLLQATTQVLKLFNKNENLISLVSKPLVCSIQSKARCKLCSSPSIFSLQLYLSHNTAATHKGSNVSQPLVLYLDVFSFTCMPFLDPTVLF